MFFFCLKEPLKRAGQYLFKAFNYFHPKATPPFVTEPAATPTSKLVASAATASNIIKGFNLPQRDVRSQSPASGRATPIVEGEEPRGK